jgi:hypothetical protein
MARHHADRDDLLREASALVERIELSPVGANEAQHVTAGFRASGSASIFFSADPVYQFNSRGELRRAYCDGLLFKAERGRLVSLRRVRQQDEVQLQRHELSDAEQQAFLAQLRDTLRQFSEQLTQAQFTVVGQAPPAADVLGRLREWLAHNKAETVAENPHA